MTEIVSTASLRAYLAELYAARSAILLRKSYSANGKTYTAANEDFVKSEIARVERKLFSRANPDPSVRIVFDRGGR